MFAPISSFREDKDQATILNETDHDDIRRRSVIEYEFSEVWALDKLESAVEEGTIRVMRKPFTAEVLRRIQDGVSSSLAIPLGKKQSFLECLHESQQLALEEHQGSQSN